MPAPSARSSDSRSSATPRMDPMHRRPRCTKSDTSLPASSWFERRVSTKQTRIGHGQDAGHRGSDHRRIRSPRHGGCPDRAAAGRLLRQAGELQLLLPARQLHHREYHPDAAARLLQTMSIKPDTWIARMARDHKMIEPFVDDQIRAGVISYGVSSYGYDVRVGDQFKVFTNVFNTLVDPKHFDPKSFVDIQADECVIPPNSFALASTIEYFRIPRDVLTVCLGKSTYARCGIIVNVTPFEPEWEGHVTIEISNTTPLPAKIYANEGIAQVLFFQSDEPCAKSYKDKKGKYQAQRGVTLPKI